MIVDPNNDLSLRSEKDLIMTAEIVELRLPWKIVGEHLRRPICDSRKAYMNVGAQSFGFCRQHNV